MREVGNYVAALEHGIARLKILPLSIRLVRELHKKLMTGVRGGHATPGELRRSQNWIGPPGSTLAQATYVPPPHEELLDHLGDWEKFLHDENLRAMAQWLFTGVMNPDEVKLQLYSRKVMDYQEEMRDIYGESTSSGTGFGSQHGHASGSGAGGTSVFPYGGFGFTPSSRSQSWSQFSFGSRSDNYSSSEGHAETRSSVPMLVPVFGEELSHVQFRSLEEQLFRAMAVLFDQQERQCVGRLVGMKAPVSLYTPDVPRKPGGEKRAKAFLEKCYKKLLFALPRREAQKRISDRAESFAETLFNGTMDEPFTAKRRVR